MATYVNGRKISDQNLTAGQARAALAGQRAAGITRLPPPSPTASRECGKIEYSTSATKIRNLRQVSREDSPDIQPPAASAKLPTLTHPRAPAARPKIWAYGVTSIVSRRNDLLPRTLKSLAAAGFPRPRLFVDDCDASTAASYAQQFGLEVSHRHPKIGALGNWMLAMLELWVRFPRAQRYMVAQDDAVFAAGLKEYLEATTDDTAKVYWNCYSFRNNEGLVAGRPPGWYEATVQAGARIDGKLPQKGLGAVCLVFNRGGVEALLSHGQWVRKPHSAGESGRQLIDGGVVSSLNQCGFREFIHAPSLTQHLGLKSTVGHNNQKQALTFDANLDARTLLQ